MADAFIFINSFALREGKLEDLRRFLGEFFAAVEASEPRLLAIHAYLNEDASEVTFVQVHPDAASLEHHQRVVHEHTQRSRQFLGATTGIQVYGTPSELVLKRRGQHAASGISVSVNPEHLGGFSRLVRPAEPAVGKPADQKTEGQRHEPPAGRQHE